MEMDLSIERHGTVYLLRRIDRYETIDDAGARDIARSGGGFTISTACKELIPTSIQLRK